MDNKELTIVHSRTPVDTMSLMQSCLQSFCSIHSSLHLSTWSWILLYLTVYAWKHMYCIYMYRHALPPNLKDPKWQEEKSNFCRQLYNTFLLGTWLSTKYIINYTLQDNIQIHIPKSFTLYIVNTLKTKNKSQV